MNEARAMFMSTDMAWARASGEASPTLVPAATEPGLAIAPQRCRISSRSVVLPL
jgi:hypothetical protein